MAITRNCDLCGASYTRPPSLVGRFCSKRCAYDARVKPREELKTSYRFVNRPNHPLATKTGVIPEHRMLLYDRLGPGTHTCHYCETTVTWQPGKRTKAGALVTEHLDRNRRNNAPENLVPCCQRCNALNRAYTVTDDEHFVVGTDGRRLRMGQTKCPNCGNTFWRLQARTGKNPAQFCSRTCARTA